MRERKKEKEGREYHSPGDVQSHVSDTGPREFH